jgi:hypothetical protein
MNMGWVKMGHYSSKPQLHNFNYHTEPKGFKLGVQYVKPLDITGDSKPCQLFFEVPFRLKLIGVI